VRAAADRLHIRLSIEHVTNQQEIEKAFASLSQLGAGAVFVLADPLFNVTGAAASLMQVIDPMTRGKGRLS